MVAACMKILNVNHPETAPVNTGVDVSIDIEVTPEEDGSSRVLVGILAPFGQNMAGILEGFIGNAGQLRTRRMDCIHRK